MKPVEKEVLSCTLNSQSHQHDIADNQTSYKLTDGISLGYDTLKQIHFVSNVLSKKSLSKPYASNIRRLLPNHVRDYYSRKESADSGLNMIADFDKTKSITSDSGLVHSKKSVQSEKKSSLGNIESGKNSIDSLIDNYNQMIAINLDHRLSLLSGELSQHLNVDFTFDQVATRIHADSYRSPKNAYWSAKVLQVCFFCQVNQQLSQKN